MIKMKLEFVTCINLMLFLFSTTIEAPNYVEMFPAYYIFNSLLILLLVLHLFWTYVILKIAYKFLAVGQVCYYSCVYNKYMYV